MGITPQQYDMLMKPIRPARIAKRSQGGKQLSYVEAWDIKAHLIRAFGFCNFDVEMIDYNYVTTRQYQLDADDEKKPTRDMVEVIYTAQVRLTLRDPQGQHLATYSEAAAGSASGPAYMLGDHHDNALKTAASDATKRCAINLGSQFGLSLYDDGSTKEVVKVTVVKPEGVDDTPVAPPTAEQAEALARSLGQVVEEVPTEEPTKE